MAYPGDIRRFSDKLTFAQHCPATRLMHRQRAVLPEHTHCSFIFDRTCRSYVLGLGDLGLIVEYVNSPLRSFRQTNVLELRFLFSCQHKFSRLHNFSLSG